jgi:gluconate 2-dehydrogenase alpha chain
VHLILLSGIGKLYEPVAQTGVIGKSYCYQAGTGARLCFEDRIFNPLRGP